MVKQECHMLFIDIFVTCISDVKETSRQTSCKAQVRTVLLGDGIDSTVSKRNKWG